MFLGEFEHALDDKSRVVLPSAIRRWMHESEVEQGFVLVPKDTGECLELHPWRAFEARIQELKATHDPHRSSAAREFLRDYAGRATRVQCDNQGRFLVPESCRQAVGIERDVQFVGLVDFVEIWPRESWRRRLESKTPNPPL